MLCLDALWSLSRFLPSHSVASRVDVLSVGLQPTKSEFLPGWVESLLGLVEGLCRGITPASTAEVFLTPAPTAEAFTAEAPTAEAPSTHGLSAFGLSATGLSAFGLSAIGLSAVCIFRPECHRPECRLFLPA